MLKKIIAVALKAGHVFQTSEELAARAAKSVRYAGGYLYSGTTWTLNRQELSGLRHFVKDYDHGGHEEADTAHNLEMLASAKIGDELRCHTLIGSCLQDQFFTKTGLGWICTHETWTLSNPELDPEVWDAALEVKKEVQRHTKALAKARERYAKQDEYHALFGLEARARLRMV